MFKSLIGSRSGQVDLHKVKQFSGTARGIRDRQKRTPARRLFSFREKPKRVIRPRCMYPNAGEKGMKIFPDISKLRRDIYKVCEFSRNLRFRFRRNDESEIASSEIDRASNPQERKRCP